MRRLGLVVTWSIVAGSVLSVSAASQTVIPTRYRADRFFAAPVSQRGDTIILLMDTGGGGVFVIKPVLERLGITPKFVQVAEGDSVFDAAPFPLFRSDASIPPALGSPRANIMGYGVRPMEAFDGAVGMVGHNWFAGRVWVLDYPGHQVSYYEAAPAPKPFGTHTIPMTVKAPLVRDDPRIQVIVAGDTIDMLLDTGATSILTPAAIAVVGPGPATRASAFAAARIWDKWHTAHPEWRVIPGGEANTHADLIGVPSVSIAGYDVGPIWFAKRPNTVYDGMMKSLMDKPISASIGGAAFRDFKITMDYVNQRVTFEKP